MHEMSLMLGIIDLLRKSAAENNISKITKVMLVVGDMTMEPEKHWSMQVST